MDAPRVIADKRSQMTCQRLAYPASQSCVSKKYACAESLHTLAAHVDAGWCRRIIDLNGNRCWHVGAAEGGETVPSSGHAAEVYAMVEVV